MSIIDDHTSTLQQTVPLQRQPSPPSAQGALAEELATALRQRDEARSFAQDLWATTSHDVRLVIQDLQGGLPSWLKRQ
jgi:hypothetical protein